MINQTDKAWEVKQFEKILNQFPGLLGHLLGRGRLETYTGTNTRSLRFVLIENSIRLQYLEWIQQNCENNNVCYGFEKMTIYQGRTTNQARLTTNYTKDHQFLSLYDFFYRLPKEVNGRRRLRFSIPETIHLLPLTGTDLAYWFIETGDIRTDTLQILFNLAPHLDKSEASHLCDLVKKRLFLDCEVKEYSSSNGNGKTNSNGNGKTNLNKKSYQIVFPTSQIKKFDSLIEKSLLDYPFENDKIATLRFVAKHLPD